MKTLTTALRGISRLCFYSLRLAHRGETLARLAEVHGCNEAVCVTVWVVYLAVDLVRWARRVVAHGARSHEVDRGGTSHATTPQRRCSSDGAPKYACSEGLRRWQYARAMELASVLIAGAALVVAGISLGYGRGQRDAAVRQANAAEAQTAVMKLQLEAMQREQETQTAHHVTAEGALSVTGTASVRTRVPPWSLAHFRGETYTLTNGSDETVYDVQVEPPEHTIFRGPEQWETIDPHAGVDFLLAFTMQSGSDRGVTVRWRWEPDGELRSWSSVAPPKR